MSNLIVGGNVAQPGRYPYMAALSATIGRYPVCGGTLIAPKLVLTAGHCGDMAEVFVGCFNLLERFNGVEEKCEHHTISEIILHPNFKRVDSIFKNDLAIVVLDSPSNNSPVPFLADGSFDLVPNTILNVAGWGVTEHFSFNRPFTLRETTVAVVDSATCNDQYFQEAKKNLIKSDMFCAALPGSDSCQADSGGPIIIPCQEANEDLLVGAVSWGFDCAHPDFPGVYARVSTSKSFIQDVANEHDQTIIFMDTAESLCFINGTKVSDDPVLTSVVPSEWTCNDFRYAALDGCHCNCGTVDPDCSNPLSSSFIFNCADGQSCNNQGVCENPTAFPTESPTVSPTTLSPTLDPTISPTKHPSISPSVKPTVSPTQLPTLSPTLAPTISPSLEPTEYPSPNPTLSPSLQPTGSPSSKPSLLPDFQPTISPSLIPSPKPTISTSESPTNSNLDNITLQPTKSPSALSTETNVPTIRFAGGESVEQAYLVGIFSYSIAFVGSFIISFWAVKTYLKQKETNKIQYNSEDDDESKVVLKVKTEV